MALEKRGSTLSAASLYAPTTEFDILKSSHRFLRSEDEDEKHLTWDDKLAKKYYNSLYREYAVCDLKHYKSGNFSLRWRTEAEVLSGAGESTCGNTRCRHHSPEPGDNTIRLNTVELPFTYIERGEAKSALVKVVLCEKCIKKLMYKRTREKSAISQVKKEEDIDTSGVPASSADTSGDGPHGRRTRQKVTEKEGPRDGVETRRHRRRSRSRSPQRRVKSHRRPPSP